MPSIVNSGSSPASRTNDKHSGPVAEPKDHCFAPSPSLSYINGHIPSSPKLSGDGHDGHPSETASERTKTHPDVASYDHINAVNAGKAFPRLSIPVELMRIEYDVVVIGSGYGGGVAASRMARGGQSVCLLELGKERWPGEYPSNLEEAAPQLHASGYIADEGPGKWFSTGDPTGLYHLVVGEGQNAFIANDYDRAESVLEPVPYPEDYPSLPKLKVLEEQAKKLGLADKFYRVKQTTRFEDGPNSVGVEMHASTLTGMDCTGVNDGSKSSTLVNYLSDAWNWGTEMFCECEVRLIKPHPKGEGYIVYFAWHGCKRGAFKQNFYSDLMWVHAKKFVFLGAGSLGTTEILLRSKEVGLKMSDRVGKQMSGNGDILAFGYNTDCKVNSIGRACPAPELPIGPTITGVIDCRAQENFLDGFVIEEGAIPESLAQVFQSLLETLPGQVTPQNFGIQERLRHLLSRQKSRILGPYAQGGSVERTQVYLIMSHDDNQAILTLKEGRPHLQFLGVGRTDHVAHLNQVLADATSRVGGTFINSPFYAAFGQKEITVHAIGGVLNLFGRPSHPYPASSADKSLHHARTIIKSAQENSSSGIKFTEVMEGNIYVGDDVDDFNIAAKAAIDSGDTARFYLSVYAWDTNILVSRNDHPALLTGTMTCRALSRDPFMVLRGGFQLFNQDLRTPDTTNLTYNFDMVSTSGEVIHFNGYKTVNSSVTFSPWATWKATSTLYVTLTGSDGTRVGRGILHIRPVAFGSEALTFTPTGPSLFAQIRSSSNFLSFFAKRVAKSFFGPFNGLQWPTASYSGYFSDKVAPAKTMKISASDGVQTTLRMWSPVVGQLSAKPKILLVPGAAVDHQIFALPTIRRNAVEFFTAAGHEVFIVTHRTGNTIIAQKGYTTFDARLDIKAGLEEIRRMQRSDDKIYVIAHCVGSVALSMALLDGTVPAEWIMGITASNVFAHPKFAKINMAKASLPVSLPKIYKAVVGSWFSCTSSYHDTTVQQIMNQALRFYPVGGVGEICNSVVCHRSELVFGRLWSHGKLNQATHANLAKFLGGTSMASLRHLMAMGVAGRAHNNTGENLVTRQSLARLQGIPIFLFSGSENAVYSPEATDMSYNALRDTLGEENYERVVFQGRGHLDCWMGADADMEVYPMVKAHVDKVSSVKHEQREKTG
ncbi:MAG: hypothetical protein M1833_001896 [Piccolia ochrophora]|nr:MAG: hypothetical protein M1833_001896 [Piccolia ochrophora]